MERERERERERETEKHKKQTLHVPNEFQMGGI